MSPTIHHHTPTLVTFDPRCLPVRTITYHRALVADIPSARINRQAYDVAGRRVEQWDPRLWALAQASENVPANQTAVYSLSGQVLAGTNVDAGWRVNLLTGSGQALQSWDSRGTQSRFEYDALLRLVAVFEQARNEDERCVERLLYAGPEATGNLCGQLIRHDDPAGTLTLDQASLHGAVLQQTRHFLCLDSPIVAHQCEPGSGALTQQHYNALGELLTLTDAKGNQQRFTSNLTGQLHHAWLQLADQAEPVLLSTFDYNAFGQIEQQVAGNGLNSTAHYSPLDGRLEQLCARKSNGAPLQTLIYQHDPVGNILSIRDEVQPVRHFNNQRIEPLNTYAYDTLYQLTEATGREAAVSDPQQFANYTQRYSYDTGGNLTRRLHVGARCRTLDMHVALYSNRAVIKHEADPLTAFDANGNLQELQPGQLLTWDLRNQLHQVTPVVRVEAANDAEVYLYDGGGQRLRKLRHTQAQNLTHLSDVRYLPGLELRTNSATGENLHVITATVGRIGVRVLHWVGEPPGGLSNDQVRYSLSDHLGSCSLELDAAEQLISQEGYYPYGGTAWWTARNGTEAAYKTVRYSGKERDATGLYYYGYRYYCPWRNRWINPDPAGNVDGLNVFAMVGNNPVSYSDHEGLNKGKPVPNVIHHFWQGDLDALKKHHANLSKIAEMNSAYSVELHVLPNKGEDSKLEGLQNALGSKIKVTNITGESWFKKFKSKDRYKQFEASRSGNRPHLASGADIIKTELIYKVGGIYNDVDNVPLAALPTSLSNEKGTLLTAGPVVFNRWGGEKGVHSSTFGSFKKNPLLKEMNTLSYQKFKKLEGVIYEKNSKTDNPDDHFKMVSETAGSLHFSQALKQSDATFSGALDTLLQSGKKYNNENILFDKYFAPTTTTGVGYLDEDQTLTLLQALSKPGHFVM